ncbi:Mammalian cell entry related domain protein [Desulfovibrio sp. X2]|uniref:outer membrane lipid asymmetry maintenance protein MlaD n=1 Tax=Desulfovibrio sp. X2 TaxID=941449 RepID=UPI000358D150|nr:outer membrane lipid asymmetry maintenance protein MlaD [Desulfovibrio sp. X2]EPR44754.1 Mammalian cell entry related domain protein [Desulfovibrio sp. X2]
MSSSNRLNLELAVGTFVFICLLCVGYLTIKLGKMEVIGGNDYPIRAEFASVTGLRAGSSVEMAGVPVGRVSSITLNTQDMRAVVTMKIAKDIKLSDDSIASIKTSGLIGDKYVSISPGGSGEYIKPGGRIIDTESAVDIEGLISKYAFGNVEKSQ